MKVITLVTDIHEHWFVNFMKPTCEFNELDLVTLTPTHYPNHTTRDKILYQYLKNIPSHEIVFYTDGYDAIFLGDEVEILEKFHKKNKEILFSAETNCYPDQMLSNKYPSSQSPFRFLNGGGFMGRVDSILKFLEENLETPSIKKFNWSNQIYWTEQFLRNMDKIGIDTQCDIFSTLSSPHDISYLNDKKNGYADFDNFVALKKRWFKSEFYVEKNRLHVISTGGCPCHVHFNGFSKVLLEDVLSLT